MQGQEKTMTPGKLLVKSIHEPAEESDGTRILVTQFPPRMRGFKKGTAYQVWFRPLAPYAGLLQLWHERKVTEQKFTELYLAYLKSNDNLMHDVGQQIHDIRAELASGKNVTLLCYERSGEFCHRHLLKEYIDQQCSKKTSATGSN